MTKRKTSQMNAIEASAVATAYARNVFSTVEFKLGDLLEESAPVILAQLALAWSEGFATARGWKE